MLEGRESSVNEPMELLSPKKLLTHLSASLAVMLIVMLLCLLVGTEPISLRAAFRTSDGVTSANPDYEILVHVRLPRVILAAVVGAALASSGVVFQALLRNPLADPYILGISSGAGLGTIVAVICGFSWTVLGRSPIAVFAFAGALATVWLVWFIGRLTGKFHVTGLLLAGVAVNAFLSAAIMLLTALAKSQQVYATIFWLMGNMTEEDFLVLWLAAGCVVTAVIALFLISPRLNALSFGDEDARSIGVNVQRTRLVAFAIAALLTAVAVSLSGLIGFVGLIVPHALRLVLGPDHRVLLPISSIIGATFLVLADAIARTIVAPAQLPVGVVTAVIGGPFFLLLLVRYNKKLGWSPALGSYGNGARK